MDELVTAFRVVDLVGVLGNAVIGASMARSRRFDPIGFAALAILSALAGGMLRDVLLQAGPPLALVDPAYLLFALLGAAFVFAVQIEGRAWRWFLYGIDALAVGAWAAAGTLKALGLGHLPMTAVLLGVITAVGGGMIRDVVIGQVPAIFSRNTLYATSALAAALTLLAVPAAYRPTIGTLAAITVGAGLCLLARWRRWTLPGAPEATVTLTTKQLAALVRRAQRDERRRTAGRQRRRRSRQRRGDHVG